MPEIGDALYVIVFAIAWPLLDYFALWPRFLRHVQIDPVNARVRFWTITIIFQWVLVGVGILLWLTHERSWDVLGFVLPFGWRLWGFAGLIIALLSLSDFGFSRHSFGFCFSRKPLFPFAVVALKLQDFVSRRIVSTGRLFFDPFAACCTAFRYHAPSATRSATLSELLPNAWLKTHSDAPIQAGRRRIRGRNRPVRRMYCT